MSENFGELTPSRVRLENPVSAASSESTKVEQARAFAEVAIQAELAKKYPRNMNEVFRRIEETFERSPGLLLKAKWKFPRGNTSLSGYTIQFARAIAECVGSIKYSFRELSRGNKQSEMLIYAWDMETNTIQDRTIIIPHTRDKTDYKTNRQYKEDIIHERDIYENNANFASRRLRECILGVLPAAARRKGEEVVESLLRNAFPEEKRQQYIESCIATFAKLGVKKELLIKERGNRPPDTWTRNDIVTFKGYAEDIERGDITIEEIFNPPEPSNIEPPSIKLKEEKPIPKSKAEKKKVEKVEKVEKKENVAHLEQLLNDPLYDMALDAFFKNDSNNFTRDNIGKIIDENNEKAATFAIEKIEEYIR